MELDLFQVLNENLVLLTFVTIGLGYLAGRIKIAGIELGTTAGVLLSGLIFGHLGLQGQAELATFGFTLFIFSVGLQAGPSFFSAFAADGVRYVAMSLFVALLSVAVAQVAARLLGLEQGFAAGLLAGALTSTPTLAGAQDAVRSGLAVIPDGLSAAEVSENVSVGYALTYVFGTVGLIVAVRYVPNIFRVDLPNEARALEAERGMARPRRRRALADTLPIIRAYEIRPESVGKTVEQATAAVRAAAAGNVAFVPLKIRRGGALLDPEPDLELEKGDVVSIIAPLAAHSHEGKVVGEEVLDPELLNYDIVTTEIVAIHPAAVGHPIRDLKLLQQYGCLITGVVRASVWIEPNDATVIMKGDRLQVTGEESRLHELAEQIGHIESKVEETDLLTFSFGIAAGVLLGLVMVKIGGVSVGFGSAGGLLLAGIMLGFMRSLHPTFGGVPPAARYVLRELGLMFFMASVGLRAGGGILEALTTVGPAMILTGVVVTLLPMILGFAFGRYVLKMNAALLLGSITGAMTSTPALSVVNDSARSGVPSLGYAGTYTFANVMLTFAGTLMMMI